MTVEEWGEVEYQRMKEREAASAQFQEEKPDSDSDNEEAGERKRKKAADWDDWCDSTHKGIGNTKRI